MKLKDWLSINKEIFTERDLNFLISIFMNNKEYVLPDECMLNRRQIDYLSGIKNSYSKGWPIAYLLRQEQFFGFSFFVRPGVLIPRPETEIITEEALNIINKNSINRVLDLCCGVSCIAIVIAKLTKKRLDIFSSDISSQALMASRENIEFYKVPVRLVKCDLLSGFREKSFDLIITNPPYVETDCIKDSLKFEPQVALDGGGDGFYFIGEILNQAYKYLRREGYLIIEIGYNHKYLLEKSLERLGIYDIVKWVEDYSSYTRGVVLRRK